MIARNFIAYLLQIPEQKRIFPARARTQWLGCYGQMKAIEHRKRSMRDGKFAWTARRGSAAGAQKMSGSGRNECLLLVVFARPDVDRSGAAKSRMQAARRRVRCVSGTPTGRLADDGEQCPLTCWKRRPDERNVHFAAQIADNPHAFFIERTLPLDLDCS
jgi:hypothetical protein